MSWYFKTIISSTKIPIVRKRKLITQTNSDISNVRTLTTTFFQTTVSFKQDSNHMPHFLLSSRPPPSSARTHSDRQAWAGIHCLRPVMIAVASPTIFAFKRPWEIKIKSAGDGKQQKILKPLSFARYDHSGRVRGKTQLFQRPPFLSIAPSGGGKAPWSYLFLT